MSAKKRVKASELCRALDIQPYVLRYWETEFRGLQPDAGSPGGQRTYSEADVLLVRRIKQLLYDEGYTIAGAKKKLESDPLEAVAPGANAELFDVPAPARANDPAPSSDDATRERTTALDTVSPERIKQLHRGIEKSLADARAVLAILDKHPR